MVDLQAAIREVGAIYCSATVHEGWNLRAAPQPSGHAALPVIRHVPSPSAPGGHAFALVGYNDIPIVSRLGTPMTTVRVPFDQIAAAALDLLTRGAEGTHDRIRVATPTLIPRRSTGPLRR